MSYAQIINVAGEDMPHYMKLMDAVGSEPVEGLIVHAAGPTADGIQIITIWISRADQERFVTERLHPAFATLPAHGRPMVTELDVHNLVVGPGALPRVTG
jgi:hypothetical protein